MIQEPFYALISALTHRFYAAVTFKNPDGDFFSQIVHSKDQQDSEPGEKIDFFGYWRRSQNLLHWREVEYCPGKNDLNDDTCQDQLVS